MPAFSQTIILKHMYHNNHMSEEEARVAKTTISPEQRFQRDEEFYDFFEDVYIEASMFGRIEQVRGVVQK